MFDLFSWILLGFHHREQHHSSQTISPTDWELWYSAEAMELSCLIAYFELSLMSLTLHIFYQNKRDHSDPANLPTAGPGWIDLRLHKGCLESRIMLRVDAALIVGALWKTAGAPAKPDLVFCLLSATSEAVHWKKTLSSGSPCHSSGDRQLPIPASMWHWAWLWSSRDASKRREP